MSSKLKIAGAAVAVVAAAYFVGYLPERSARRAAQTEAEELRTALAAAETRVRTAELLGRILLIRDVVSRQDYGQARQLSSSFFDAVRAEASTSPEPTLREALNAALGERDTMTSQLATGTPSVLDAIRGVELRLRQALGYAVPDSAP